MDCGQGDGAAATAFRRAQTVFVARDCPDYLAAAELQFFTVDFPGREACRAVAKTDIADAFLQQRTAQDAALHYVRALRKAGGPKRGRDGCRRGVCSPSLGFSVWSVTCLRCTSRSDCRRWRRRRIEALEPGDGLPRKSLGCFPKRGVAFDRKSLLAKENNQCHGLSDRLCAISTPLFFLPDCGR